jgi:hypothetical protein
LGAATIYPLGMKKLIPVVARWCLVVALVPVLSGCGLPELLGRTLQRASSGLSR